MNKTGNYQLTVIVPVFNEEGNILRLEKELGEFLQTAKMSSCVLFVNDGSKDDSERLIQEVCGRNKDFFFLNLARNGGLSAAMKAGKDIALANKETLVTAGHIIIPLAKETGVKILPVDSEHSAIFQCLNGEDRGALHKILLTASGGPFRGKKREELQSIQVEDALKHPNWAMGRKITIDSSTLVNKGLEMMEARWLFGVEPKDIQIVVQPKSIIHSMVEFVDGAVIAQLGTPDMKLPIQYALYYPERRYLPGERLDFGTLTQITFEKPDMETFTGLKLAFDAAAAGGSMPTVYNAANEKAVALFLDRKIGWLSIPEIIEASMGAHPVIPNPSVEEILETEQAVYEFIESRW